MTSIRTTDQAEQQDRALRVAAEMRVAASEARQLGLRHTADWIARQVRGAERWARKVLAEGVRK